MVSKDKKVHGLKFTVAICIGIIPTEEVGQIFVQDYYETVNREVLKVTTEEIASLDSTLAFKSEYKVDDELEDCIMEVTGVIAGFDCRALGLGLMSATHKFIESLDGGVLATLTMESGELTLKTDKNEA